MISFRAISTGSLVGLLLLTVLTNGLWFQLKPVMSASEFPAGNSNAGELSNPGPVIPDPLGSTSTYYAVRRDLRRCASPLCGGYFVSRVNQALTRCANRKYQAQCYVAEIDWNGQAAVEAGNGPENSRALLRGDLVDKTFQPFGKLGVLRVRESWSAANDKPANASFYRVRDLGVRCITHPCLTHHAAKLNTSVQRKLAGVDLNATGAPDDWLSRAFTEMTSPAGVVVAGSEIAVKGPAGRAFTLKASQLYLRPNAATANKESSSKGCIRTGCSGIVCADQEMMSTCEWKDEYECYKTARCERQQDGKCGWTKTTELTECIASKRRP